MKAGPFVVALLALAGCSRAVPPQPPPIVLEIEAEPVPEPEPFPFEHVWTARPEIDLVDEDGMAFRVPRLFARMDVVGRDTVGLRVRCTVCDGVIEGYVTEEEVVFAPSLPEIAAWATLPEFALAIRDAALRRDLQALRPLMAPDFSFSFIGPQNPDAAFAVWISEQFRSLDQVPALLDQGLATRDEQIWSAPPAFLRDVGYRDLRLGFRRRFDGRWEWLYLIRGIESLDSP